MSKRLMAVAMQEGMAELAVLIDTLEMDLDALIDGLLYCNYEFTHYKNHRVSRTVRNINLITSSVKIKDFNTKCYVYSAVYEGIYMVRDLINMPP